MRFAKETGIGGVGKEPQGYGALGLLSVLGCENGYMSLGYGALGLCFEALETGYFQPMKFTLRPIAKKRLICDTRYHIQRDEKL